ncbi:hypothetical protein QNM99_10030 [Pseudomonas sp. PCH446]
MLLARNEDGWVSDPMGLLLALGRRGVAAYILMMKKVGRLFQGFEGLSVSLLAAALIATPWDFGRAVVTCRCCRSPAAWDWPCSCRCCLMAWRWLPCGGCRRLRLAS